MKVSLYLHIIPDESSHFMGLVRVGISNVNYNVSCHVCVSIVVVEQVVQVRR